MRIDNVRVSSGRATRVLHVLEATLGGTLRYMENVVEATRGPDLVCGFAYGTARADSRLEPLLARMSRLGWSTYPVDMRREVNIRKDLRAWLQLRRAATDFQPDIIHCHSSKAGALGRTCMLFTKNRPVRVYSPHALSASLGKIYLRIEELLAPSTRLFIAVSETERNQILEYALAAAQNIDVVYPSIDSAWFCPAPQRLARSKIGFGPGPVVLAIGRLTAQKDPAAFVEIVKRIYAQRPDLQAVWVGSGEDESDFTRRIIAAGLEHVIQLVPWQHDVRQYIAAADVFLTTSRFESFGYVTAEALAMGRPVVATDVVGTRDIMFNKFREWLYPPEHPEIAAALVLKLLRNPWLADATGAAGRSEVQERFSIERMSTDLAKVYHNPVLHSSSYGSREPIPSVQ